jgi:GT2 family glycosyltransferase
MPTDSENRVSFGKDTQNLLVVSIIVTYADRSDFVSQVIRGCRNEGINRIILIDNGSHPRSASTYDAWASESSDITLIRLAENSGSAGGYATGIRALDGLPPGTFVWLLDDDTVPQENSLKYLMSAWEHAQQGKGVVLYANRTTRTPQYLYFGEGRISRYHPDNFMGFNFTSWFRQKVNTRSEVLNYPLVRTEYGPYGGLFTTVSMLSLAGVPDESLFTYADDHEYTLRFNSLNIAQFNVFHAQLVDVDASFDAGGLFNPTQDNTLKYRYTIRNHTWLSQRFIKNIWAYQFNKMMYLIKQLAINYRSNQDATTSFNTLIRQFLQAVRDGEAGRLGKISESSPVEKKERRMRSTQ